MKKQNYEIDFDKLPDILASIDSRLWESVAPEIESKLKNNAVDLLFTVDRYIGSNHFYITVEFLRDYDVFHLYPGKDKIYRFNGCSISYSPVDLYGRSVSGFYNTIYHKFNSCYGG